MVQNIDTFGLEPGRIIARRYEVAGRLGGGWEGEVYKIVEISTGIERAAKFFFPKRNPKDRAVRAYAKKLYKLRHCPILIQYHHQESITFRGRPVTFLVSDYVEGELLSAYVARQPGQRLGVFEALTLLHTLAVGIETIHQQREYHGDLHDNNIIVRRFGIGYDVKLLDLYHWGAPRQANIDDDVCNLVRVFYDVLGGAKRYAQHPPEIKGIICGLKRSLILRKFRSAGELREYLETMIWE